MLCLGAIYLLLVADWLSFSWGMPLTRAAKISPTLIYVSPGLFLAEAIYYWRARRTNIYRSLSWSHVILSVFVLFAFLFCEWAFSSRELFTGGGSMRSLVLSLLVVQTILCWFLMVVAHFLFLLVLIKVQIRVENLKTAVKNDSGNILDDILA